MGCGMNETLVVELVRQGGFAILCGVMFWVYRRDSMVWAVKQSETASAFMAFGERTATSLTSVSEALRQQSDVLRTLERHLAANHLCPVTQVTTELLRDRAQGGLHVHERLEDVVRSALKARQGELEPREGK